MDSVIVDPFTGQEITVTVRTVQSILPPIEDIIASVCAVCGCTDMEACCTDWRYLRRGHPPRDLAARCELREPTATCRWVAPGLCSRCWRFPDRVTAYQRHELARIRDRARVARVWPLEGCVLAASVEQRDSASVVEIPPSPRR